MNSNIKYGLLGLAITAMTSVALSGTAAAQFPNPETNPSNGVYVDIFSDTPVTRPATIEAPAPIVAKPQAEFSELDVVTEPVDGQEQRSLIDSASPSAVEAPSKPTAAEMRQARALFRSQQRIERLERNQWAGYEPLRPNWNSIPMMSSRYPERGVIVVPLYFYP